MINSKSLSSSAPAGYRFPREVIALAVRWYLRYGLSYRDVEELLSERGIQVDHVTVYRWVHRFTPLLADAIVAYHGGAPASVAEIGAGTGKGTEVLAALGAPMTCIEPDPRMAAVLSTKHPQAQVYVGKL